MQGNVKIAPTPKFSKEQVLTYAREVFGSSKKMHSWLTTPNQAFNGMRPQDLVDMGVAEDLSAVHEELGRIDNGLF